MITTHGPVSTKPRATDSPAGATWRLSGQGIGNLLFFALVVWIAGCGYKSAASQRVDLGIQTVAIDPFENLSNAFEVEQFLTRAVARSFVEKSSYRVVNDPVRADAVLSGIVTTVRASPVIFGRTSLGSTFLVTLQARVEFKDRRTGKTLFSKSDYRFREQYQINPDVENFFSEQNPALRRIADDFADALVTTIIEGF